MSEDSQAAGAPGEQPMPQVSLGPHKISRLILGGNPTSGGVHMPRMFNYQIKRYYTPERVVQTLADCENNGISVWQTCPTRGFPTNLAMYQRHKEQGGKMQYMSIAAEMPASRGPVPENFSIAKIAEAGAIAIAHWGSFTDRAWRAGKMDQVRDYLKRVRDAGLVVGVSTHRPDVVDYVESFPEIHAAIDKLFLLLGQLPVPFDIAGIEPGQTPVNVRKAVFEWSPFGHCASPKREGEL